MCVKKLLSWLFGDSPSGVSQLIIAIIAIFTFFRIGGGVESLKRNLVQNTEIKNEISSIKNKLNLLNSEKVTKEHLKK